MKLDSYIIYNDMLIVKGRGSPCYRRLIRDRSCILIRNRRSCLSEHSLINTTNYSYEGMRTLPQTIKDDAILNELNNAIMNAVGWLERNQHPDGYWVGMLETNSCMEAQWIMALHFLGVKNDPKYTKVIRCILNEQRSDGSWDVYYGASKGDINATVECYAALRTAGIEPDSDALKQAGKWILENGGLKGIRVFTKYWLALIGEWPWQDTPALPPELIFFPAVLGLHLVVLHVPAA